MRWFDLLYEPGAHWYSYDFGMAWTYTPTSRTFVAYRYAVRGGRLTLVFRKSQSTYLYYGIPLRLYEAFDAAQSKGAFYNRRIKDRFRADLVG